MDRKTYEKYRQKALDYYERAGIVLTDREKEALEIADFGLNDLDRFGLQLVTYINTSRVCAKEMVLFPWQICPEHRHPPFGDYPGKEETCRVRFGCVYLVVPGEPTGHVRPEPEDKRGCFTAHHEVRLGPGEQYTIALNTPHWFYAGEEGAVVSEFSTPSFDEQDIFTDAEIIRKPNVE